MLLRIIVADLQTYLFNTIPQSTFETLFISIVITLIVGIILFIVFSIFHQLLLLDFLNMKVYLKD